MNDPLEPAADSLSPEGAELSQATFLERVATTNPFLDNRVKGPAHGEIDVPDIHCQAFERLTALALEAQRVQCGIGALLWGEAGVGKSHLLARLGRWAWGNFAAPQAGPRAVFTDLHNLQAAPETLPHTLLSLVVNNLTLGRRDHLVNTPLFLLVRAAVCAAVGNDLRFHSWAALARAYHTWFTRLASTGIDRTPFQVLFTLFRSAQRFAQGKEDGNQARLALRWLSGEALDPEEGRALRLPLPRRHEDTVGIADAQQVKQVLVAFTHLAAAQHQPFVLAFDQVENLETSQFSALARFLEALLDSSPNLLVVTTGLQPTLLTLQEKGVIQRSAWDRVGQFTILLQRLNGAEARSLVRDRLERFRAPFLALPEVAEAVNQDDLYPLGSNWAKQYLDGRNDLRSRDVINLAREGWETVQQSFREEQPRTPEVAAEQETKPPAEAWNEQPEVAVERETKPPAEAWNEQPEIDRLVAGQLGEHVTTREKDPGRLLPNADQLTGILTILLQGCQEAGLFGLSSVHRLPQMGGGRRQPYQLELVQELPAHDGRGAETSRRTGVGISTATSAVAITQYLNGLRDDSRRVERTILVTDERIGLPVGARGREHLEALRTLGPERFREIALTFREHARLEALQVLLGRARVGNLEIARPGGPAQALNPVQVIGSYHRQKEFESHRLLNLLLDDGTPAVAKVPTSQG
jgi:hypothetical protein